MIGRRKNRELFELLKDKKKERKEVKEPIPSAEFPSIEQKAGTASVISLKQETCIFGAIILILLVIFAFILGYYRGRNDAASRTYSVPETAGKHAEQQVASAARPRPVTSPPSMSVPPLKETVPAAISPRAGDTQPPHSSEGKYTLRVWTGGRLAVGKAREIVEFFRSKGFAAWSKKGSEGIKVLIGRFKSKSEADAVRTRNQVRELIYKGSKPFQDCYFVRLES